MPVLHCRRCGLIWESQTARKSINFCFSCRTKRMKTVDSEMGKCLPWHGFFDDDEVTPVSDSGEPYLPGIRLCGNNDCVEKTHIRVEGSK